MSNFKKFVALVILSLCCFGKTLVATEINKSPQEIAREKLLMLLSGEWVSRGLYVATKLEIADHLQEGAKSIGQLANATHSNPESLHRLLRMLAGFGVFEEDSPGVFRNTQASLLLSRTHPDTLHALSLFYGEDIHRSWEELEQSIHTNTPAFELTFKQPVFHYFRENPSQAALFQAAMKEKSMAVIKSTLSAYDFSKFASIYDIGGGQGQFMSALHRLHPHLNLLVFDLPEVIETIQEPTSFQVQSGNFFTSIPSEGDAYLLKSVLHDWDDGDAEKILQQCHRAMHEQSRLLIIEAVLLPEDQSLYANCMDILMLAITGGKERTLASFEQILDRSGFVLERIYPTSTEFSILEARKKTTSVEWREVKKYTYKEYQEFFPEQFEREKNRISSVLGEETIVEHVGSSAVPDLGGKGIIDIAIVVDKDAVEIVLEQLKSLGYFLKPSGCTEERFFLVHDRSTESFFEMYHVHLTHRENRDWEEMIALRDYLRTHPEEVEAYAKLKEEAVQLFGENGAEYRKLKAPFMKRILEKIAEESK